MARIAAPRSAPGWFCTIFAVLTILRQIIALADTKPVMNEFNIRDENSVRIMALLLASVNSYELIGALEENWNIYWFSLISRFVAAGLMYWLQGGWENMAHIEIGGAVVLAGCMWWSRGREEI